MVEMNGILGEAGPRLDDKQIIWNAILPSQYICHVQFAPLSPANSNNYTDCFGLTSRLNEKRAAEWGGRKKGNITKWNQKGKKWAANDGTKTTWKLH